MKHYVCPSCGRDDSLKVAAYVPCYLNPNDTDEDLEWTGAGAYVSNDIMFIDCYHCGASSENRDEWIDRED